MNNKQRKEIREAIAKLEEVKETLARIYEEEDEKMTNAPESLVNSERYDKMYAAAETIDSAASDLEDMVENLNEAIL